MLLLFQDADVLAKQNTSNPILLGAIVAFVAVAAVISAYLMSRNAASDSADVTRIKWGASMTAIAFVAIVAVFSVAVWMFDTANDVVATVGVITGLMGTVIGTFFGVQVGSSGTQAATDAAIEAAKSATEAQMAAQSASAAMTMQSATVTAHDAAHAAGQAPQMGRPAFQNMAASG